MGSVLKNLGGKVVVDERSRKGGKQEKIRNTKKRESKRERERERERESLRKMQDGGRDRDRDGEGEGHTHTHTHTHRHTKTDTHTHTHREREREKERKRRKRRKERENVFTHTRASSTYFSGKTTDPVSSRYATKLFGSGITLLGMVCDLKRLCHDENPQLRIWRVCVLRRKRGK